LRRTIFALMRTTGLPPSEIESWPIEDFNDYVDELNDYLEELSKAFSRK
jgi:hypothetical protein